MTRGKRHDAGFTLVELMIVMAIIGVLAMVAVPSYIKAIQHAREAVLKEDLHTLREAIDSYTMDKQKAPQSLDDLLQDGYLKTIPEDPMTKSNTTWVSDRPRCGRCALRLRRNRLRRTTLQHVVKCLGIQGA